MRYTPELGQMCFGNPTSYFACPNFIEAGLTLLASEIERVECNITQKEYISPTANVGGEYHTDVFDVYSYYWGDCICGYEERKEAWGEENEHEETCYQALVKKELLNKGWTKEDGFLSRSVLMTYEKAYEIEDEVRAKYCKQMGLSFPNGCAVHCTCDYKERWERFCSKNGHKSDCPTIRANFKHGTFEICWYKYLGRGMSMNRQIDANEFFEIIDKCIESVRAKEPKDGFGD